MTTNVEIPLSKMIEYFEYLDRLRETGITNMFGSPPYLRREFGMSAIEARGIFKLWVNTFSDESPEVRAGKLVSK